MCTAAKAVLVALHDGIARPVHALLRVLAAQYGGECGVGAWRTPAAPEAEAFAIFTLATITVHELQPGSRTSTVDAGATPSRESGGCLVVLDVARLASGSASGFRRAITRPDGATLADASTPSFEVALKPLAARRNAL
ncbi:hypothetical protein [Lysobacter humi (ex Lee et al. 2017)]